MEIFDVNYVRHPVSFFVTGFLNQETAALARAYLGIGSGSGSVTNTGNLTLGQVVVGNGLADIKVLASPANATRFLNGAATPAFAAVKDSDLSTSDITTNDATAAKHGFLPKLSGISSEFLDGTGAFSTPTGGSGSVTNTGTLTDHAIIVGNGGVDVSALASLGTAGDVLTSNGAGADPSFQSPPGGGNVTTGVTLTDHGVALGNGGVDIIATAVGATNTLLHGNTGADPTFSAVVEADITLANNTTNNVSTTKHGFAPILPNDASKFLDGTGAYSTPAGGGTVTNTGTLTDHGVTVGNGGTDISALAVGATNTVLHGNTGADPSFSAVVEADITLANNTTNNVSTSKHGFAPILPNDATKYLDGTGAYTVPAGGGGTDPWYQWLEASLIPTSAASTFDPTNCQNVSSATTFTSIVPTVNNFQGLQLATSTSIDNICSTGSSSGTGGQFLIGFQGEWVGYFMGVSTTNLRLMCGITAVSPTTQTGSDTPTGNYACFRYSSTAANANWWFVVGDGSSTEAFDTGVAVSTTVMQRLEIRWDGTASGSFDAYINGANVANGTLNPANTVAFHFSSALRVLSNGTAKSFQCFGQKIRQKWTS